MPSPEHSLDYAMIHEVMKNNRVSQPQQMNTSDKLQEDNIFKASGSAVQKALHGYTTLEDQELVRKAVADLKEEDVKEFFQDYNKAKGSIGERTGKAFCFCGGYLGATVAYLTACDHFFLQTLRESDFQDKEKVIRTAAEKLAKYAQSVGEYDRADKIREILQLNSDKLFNESTMKLLDIITSLVVNKDK